MKKKSSKTSRSSTDWSVECQKTMEQFGHRLHEHVARAARNTREARAACWHVVRAHLDWIRNAQPEYLAFVKKQGTTIDDYLDTWLFPLLSELNRADIIKSIQDGISLKEFVGHGAAPFLASRVRNKKRPPEPRLPEPPIDKLPLAERCERWKSRCSALEATVQRLREEVRELRQVLARVEAEATRIRRTAKAAT